MFLAVTCDLTTQQGLDICIPNKGLRVCVVRAADFLEMSFSEVISLCLVSSRHYKTFRTKDRFSRDFYKATLKKMGAIVGCYKHQN